MRVNRLALYPYKIGSVSARLLRRGLSSFFSKKTLLVKPNGAFKPRPTTLTINWGSSTNPSWKGTILNKVDAVKLASNKINAFRKFSEAEVPIPAWTTDKNEAIRWREAGETIVVRHIVSGHSGRGIEIIQPGTEQILPDAPLYTCYRKKRAEYRVHVFGGKVIDTSQKKKSREANQNDSVDTFVRSHLNGWVFCRNGIVPCDARNALAIKAVQVLGLDFGAVDIIWNERHNQYYVLEVNTAPGIEGTTLQKYIDTIKEYCEL